MLLAINTYYLIIGASLLLILSYIFNIIARRTFFPSVLLLLLCGIIIKVILPFSQENIAPVLDILGVVGIIIIVLEAAMDIKLQRNKIGLLFKSFGLAMIGTVTTTLFLGYLFKIIYNVDLLTGLINATPLAILSSAIIIPTVEHIEERSKERMIFESSFADILGIILFYFLIDFTESTNIATVSMSLLLNVCISIILALAVSYALITLFQQLNPKAKFFILLSTLLIFYSLGKLMHLSSLIIIFLFGLMLNNKHVFFRGIFKHLLEDTKFGEIQENFKMLTTETSFVIRTFYFVLFGTTIVFSDFLHMKSLMITCIALFFIYILRFASLKVMVGKKITPDLYIAPRGLLTVLLFYSIPEHILLPESSKGLIFLVIVVSIGIMAYGMKKYKSGMAQAKEHDPSPEDIRNVSVDKPDGFSTDNSN